MHVSKFLTISYFWVCPLLGWSQVHQNVENSSKKQLPELEDWFLSTGNWQSDPQLYVREFGGGKDTVIMLHGGWGAEHSGFIAAVRDLKNDFRFIFYDQRGSLRSPFPDSLITFNEHIEDLERLRQELKLNKLNIVGHSMGAVLASAYAFKYPNRIKKLTLLAPAHLKNPIPEEDIDIQHQESLAFQEFMDRPAVKRELKIYGLNRESPPLSSLEETSKSRINFGSRMLYNITKWSNLTGGGALYKGNVFPLTASTYPRTGWDYIQEFKRESYPVNILVGDHDFLDFGNELIKKWVKGINQINLVIVTNAGHMIWLDQPEVFTSELKLLLTK